MSTSNLNADPNLQLETYTLDHFNKNILIYAVISFITFVCIHLFTLVKGLNTPQISFENSMRPLNET